jgi:hypothetical protein
VSESANILKRMRSIVQSGVVAKLSSGAKGVLLVYIAHADYATGHAFPSLETVADLIGHKNHNRVRQFIRELEAAGALATIDAGGGRNRPATREILMMETGTYGVPLSDIDTGTYGVPVSEIERGTVSDVKGDGFEAKGGQNSTQRGTPYVPRSYISLINTINTSGGKDGDGGGEMKSEGEKSKDEIRSCRDALKTLGINDPIRSQIAAIPGMSAALIYRTWREVQLTNPKNPPGLLVKRLTTNPAEQIADFVAEQSQAREISEAKTRRQENEKQFRSDLKPIEERFCRIYREETAAVEASLAEILELTKSRASDFTERLLQCEAERLCNSSIPDGCENVRQFIQSEARRAIAAKAFQAKTYHETEWFKQFTEAPTLVGANY